MIKTLISKIEGELPPDLEEKYRERYLRDDSRQAIICITFLSLSLMAFIYNDYLILGVSRVFFTILIVRSLLLIMGIFLLIYLQHVKKRDTYEWLTFAWVMVGIGLIALVDYTRPPNYIFHIITDIIVIMVVYYGIPNRLILWALGSILYSASIIFVLVSSKSDIPPAAIFTSIFALVMVNFGGLFLVRRMNGYRRKHFLISNELDNLASHDSLTGILNRRMFLELSEKELARYKRYHQNFLLLIMDIDRFKDINDTYGHLEGDKVLKELAKIISSRIRSSDIFGRIGGDEFGLLLIETSLGKVSDIANQLRAACQEARITTDDNRIIKFTISVGLTETRGSDTNLDDTIRRADVALYKAKQAGKDVVVISS
jgi:diguanylate cyclase (GGDEF)-like protein